MIPSSSTLAPCIVLLCACTGEQPQQTIVEDAGPRPVDLSSIRSKPVDTLNRAQSRALCEEDARQLDLCMERGIAEHDESTCDDVVARCHANLDGGRTDVDCTSYDLAAAGPCAVTVDEYLACAAAWNATQTCANAGRYLETPAACSDVAARCPRLATSFTRSGTPPPCEPDSGAPAHTGDDLHGFDGCRPRPKRFIVLGDSIAACYSVDAAHCGPLLVGQYLKDTAAPELSVESYAVSGALIADLPAQARQVPSGPGPIVVFIHILGNDLALRHIDYDAWSDDWTRTFDYLTDVSRFPGGATFLFNTQYSPYDQCPDPLGGRASISVAADRMLQTANQREFIGLAVERPDTVTVDQYPDFLGHGDNANVRGCPHCGKDNTSWMAPDGIHPNALGYAHMTAKWELALDRMYGPGCHGG